VVVDDADQGITLVARETTVSAPMSNGLLQALLGLFPSTGITP
jgi:hypothetical protein